MNHPMWDDVGCHLNIPFICQKRITRLFNHDPNLIGISYLNLKVSIFLLYFFTEKCPDATYTLVEEGENQYCYKYYSTKVPFQDGKTACELEGTQLMSVTTQGEHELVQGTNQIINKFSIMDGQGARMLDTRHGGHEFETWSSHVKPKIQLL